MTMKITEMEEYTHHIIDNKTTTETGIKTSFCGENVSMEFYFVDVDHAVRERQARGRLLLCKHCKNAIRINPGRHL